ncbi:MAG TPA: gluconokinase [Devosia sp.]|nr:gluconokinase [Devosia sp.]
MATSSMSTAASRPRSEDARIVVVMGVSSSGKTTIGEEIARRLHAPFLDGDQYHPEANIRKMSAGIPLTDEDRWPWLKALSEALHEAAGRKGVAVGACSALKRAYRDYMVATAGEPIVFVYLDGSFELIQSRIHARQHHFMPESLLKSQFDTLEPPGDGENFVAVKIDEPPARIAEAALKKLPWLHAFKRGQ